MTSRPRGQGSSIFSFISLESEPAQNVTLCVCCRQIEEAFPANSRSGSQAWDGIDRHAKSKLHSEASNFNTSFSHHHDKTKDSWQSLKKFPFYEHSEMLCTYSAVCERNHLSKCYYLRVTGNATYYFLFFSCKE